MAAMVSQKKQLRQEMLALRRGLAPGAVAAKGAAIAEQLRRTDAWRRADTILSYVTSVDNPDNEVPTRELIAEGLSSGRTVLVPIALRGGVLQWSRLGSFDDLAPSRFGVLEPREECRLLLEPPEGALCLTPGIAFTRDGYRIGYGGGFYDRFLARFEGLAVGLAFAEQLIEAFPRQDYDIPVHAVLTDTGCHGVLR